MFRRTDNSGIPNTCPKIDEVISCIKTVTFDDTGWYDETGIIGTLEDIRSANSSLREWGNEMFSEREEFEEKAEELERENDDLKEQLLEANKRILELEERYLIY